MILASRVAEQVDGVLDGPDIAVSRLGSLDSADTSTLCFLMPGRAATANPGALIQRVGEAPGYTGTRILVENPYLAFAKASALFDSPWHSDSGIHPSAHIDPTATIGDDVQVGAGAVIDAHVTIHSKVSIGPNTWIGEGVEIGAASELAGNVSLYHGVRLGKRCRVHSGAVIGADGFGFAPSEKGWTKIHQLGGVWVGSDVEIGANTTIDRGALDDTYIADGVKIDNQVMIAHNCKIGRHNLICSQVGIAGSSKTGDYVVLAGQVGLKDHITLGDHTIVGAQAGVMDDCAGNEVYLGSPATPQREQMQIMAVERRLPEMRREMKTLKREIEQLKALLIKETEEATPSEKKQKVA